MTQDKSCARFATVKTGILLTNLGTPNAPTPKAVRRYLAEFLSDPRVVKIPRLIWLPLLYGIILRVRPRKTAALYRAIWDNEKGSPLLYHSKDLTEKLHALADDKSISVKLAMRYGDPSLEQTLAAFREEQIQRLIILPLYPQYAEATTGTTFAKVSEILTRWRWLPTIVSLHQYADNDAYIRAVADSIKQHWQTTPKSEHLIFSYHGLPADSRPKGDPYACYCEKTTRLLRETLNLNNEETTLTYQSRFGPAKWLQPYTIETLTNLALQGVKSVDVVCPGFAVDCLETLEEIRIQNAEAFVEAGGERLNYIPALNASDQHAAMLYDIVKPYL